MAGTTLLFHQRPGDDGDDARLRRTSPATPRSADSVLVPFRAARCCCSSTRHYPRGADGKLRLDPAQVLETWWIAVNPGAGCGRAAVLPGRVAGDEGRHRRTTRRAGRSSASKSRRCPSETIDGRQAIAPAEKWEKQQQRRKRRTLPGFPVPLFRARPRQRRYRGADDETSHLPRTAFGCACWTQDQIHWAYAGKATEAADGLVRRFRIASPMCRFPLYGREGPDSCPDFDHFGAGSVALQRMLVQEARRQDRAPARLAGGLGCRFQATSGARNRGERNGSRWQTDILGDRAPLTPGKTLRVDLPTAIQRRTRLSMNIGRT